MHFVIVAQDLAGAFAAVQVTAFACEARGPLEHATAAVALRELHLRHNAVEEFAEAHVERDIAHGGLRLAPDYVEEIMKATASKTPCPIPPLVVYSPVGLTPDFYALCVGTTNKNGFYGRGIVSALGAVS